MHHWVSEAERFFPAMEVVAVTGDPSQRRALYARSSSRVLVVSTGSAMSDADALAAREWDCLVLDEGHSVRAVGSLLR